VRWVRHQTEVRRIGWTSSSSARDIATTPYEHTRSWSRLIQSYDGFVFVFPRYNWGYPGVLKNALDYVYHEWRDKPASFITYGIRGGNKAADQVTAVLHGLHMRVLTDHVEALITDDDADRQLIDVNTTLQPTRPRLAAVDARMSEALNDTQ
jgi:NAD(P)H-dependent FMN reductase